MSRGDASHTTNSRLRHGPRPCTRQRLPEAQAEACQILTAVPLHDTMIIELPSPMVS